MIIGTFLGSASSAREYLTPWFPSGADNAVILYEIIHSNLSGTLDVTIYHKNQEDPGSAPGSPTGTFSQLGSTGVYRAKVSGIKEMMRLKVKVPLQADGDDDSIVYRFLPPTWYATAT